VNILFDAAVRGRNVENEDYGSVQNIRFFDFSIAPQNTTRAD